MSVKKFTSIPVEVEAIQYNGSNHYLVQLFAATVYYGKRRWWSRSKSLLIKTKEGVMAVSIGDYVVKEPFPTGDRDFYPCKQEIFEDRYRENK